jgi:hypothetical protein
MKILKPCGLAALCLVLTVGCSLYRNDRQYVYDSEYYKVRQLYDRTGSIDIVERVLRDREWTRGQINEVRYRLNQDYYLENGEPRGIDRPQPVISNNQALQLGIGRTPTGQRNPMRF